MVKTNYSNMPTESLWQLCKKNRGAVSLSEIQKSSDKVPKDELDSLIGENQTIIDLDENDLKFNIPPYSEAYKSSVRSPWTDDEVTFLSSLIEKLGFEVALIAAHFPNKNKSSVWKKIKDLMNINPDKYLNQYYNPNVLTSESVDTLKAILEANAVHSDDKFDNLDDFLA